MHACSSAVRARRNCPRSVAFMQLLIPLLQLLLTLHTVRNSLSCGSTQHCISIVLISFQCLEPKQKEEVRRSSCHNWTRMVIRLGRFTDTDRDQSRWVLLVNVNCMDPTKLFDKPRAHCLNLGVFLSLTLIGPCFRFMKEAFLNKAVYITYTSGQPPLSCHTKCKHAVFSRRYSLFPACFRFACEHLHIVFADKSI